VPQALLAALLWGASDALTGLASRRASPLFASFWLHVVSLAAIIPFALAGGMPAMSAQTLGLAALAGALGAIGDVLFGRALSRSPMTVGLPLVAVLSAAVPAAIAVAMGERPTALAGIGMAGAAAASLLAAWPENGRPALAGAGLSLLAGLAFGAMFVVLSRTPAAESASTLMVMRACGLALLCAGAVRGGAWRKLASRKGLALSVLSGATSIGANALYVLAMVDGARASRSAVAIALSAPFAMLLAHWVERERLTVAQRGSAACAVLALALLVVR
jgi:drug/metabolite transporter (DMT)-like permease